MPDKKPILDPAFWRERIEYAQSRNQIRESVFRCTDDEWNETERRQRERLAASIGPSDSVLDAGCGYGRLLDLMPKDWQGPYLGVDLSPDFIALARKLHPGRSFRNLDLRDLREICSQSFNVAIASSIKGMVTDNLGKDAWAAMEAELNRVAGRLLVLEYSTA